MNRRALELSPGPIISGINIFVSGVGTRGDYVSKDWEIRRVLRMAGSTFLISGVNRERVKEGEQGHEHDDVLVMSRFLKEQGKAGKREDTLKE